MKDNWLVIQKVSSQIKSDLWGLELVSGDKLSLTTLSLLKSHNENVPWDQLLQKQNQNNFYPYIDQKFCQT